MIHTNDVRQKWGPPHDDVWKLCDEVDRLRAENDEYRQMQKAFKAHMRAVEQVAAPLAKDDGEGGKWHMGRSALLVLKDAVAEVIRLRAVVQAADEVWRCQRCGGGGLIAPGDWCQTCAGDGLRVEWADDGSDLRPLVEALAALEDQ